MENSEELDLYLSGESFKQEEILISLIKFNFPDIENLKISIDNGKTGLIRFKKGTADEIAVKDFINELLGGNKN